MRNKQIMSHQLFSLLEGTWTGEGRGQYPTITSFDYQETLTFTRRDENSLAYEQRTQKRMDGQTEYLVSHWENGFIRILESGELEMVNAQSGGRSEVMIGTLEVLGTTVQINFVSKAVINDPRMICTARTFHLDPDILRYEMEMEMTKVDRLTSHLKMTLHRLT